MGVFEFDQFGEGTRSIATTIAGSEAFSLAGGGDTLAALEKYGVTSRISYISTGGGAFLEFVEGRALPAVAILEDRARELPPAANRAPAANSASAADCVPAIRDGEDARSLSKERGG